MARPSGWWPTAPTRPRSIGLRDQVEAVFGPADVLAAFAGGGRGRPRPVAETPVEDWRTIVDGNLTATFLTPENPAAWNDRAGPRRDRHHGLHRRTDAYSRLARLRAAKAGVIMLTRQVAGEVGRHGVRVNCLVPHTILTEQLAQYMADEQQRERAATIPLGRLGTPTDVALATLFLVSGSAAWLTGITSDVAGGAVMS